MEHFRLPLKSEIDAFYYCTEPSQMCPPSLLHFLTAVTQWQGSSYWLTSPFHMIILFHSGSCFLYNQLQRSIRQRCKSDRYSFLPGKVIMLQIGCMQQTSSENKQLWGPICYATNSLSPLCLVAMRVPSHSHSSSIHLMSILLQRSCIISLHWIHCITSSSVALPLNSGIIL